MRPGLAVVIQLVIASIVQAYNDGDVQLIGDDDPSFDGVLQVYYQGSWNTVCYDNSNGFNFDVNEVTATAVCRQLGYINYADYDLVLRYNYHSSLSVITRIRCPLVMTPTEAEILNILRCNVSRVVPSGEANCDILAIECEKTRQDFYNGQVRIHPNHNHNYPLLEINLEDDWRPICISTADDGMGSFIADSACRQMGYTNANASSYLYPSEKFNRKSWKIDIQPRCFDTETTSSPCFTDCINQYTAVDKCAADDDNLNVYELTCVFDRDNQVFYSSGTENICRYSSSESIDVRFYSVTGSLSFVVLVLSIVVIVQCCLLRCRRPKPLAAANNLAAEPNYGALRAQRQRQD